MAQPRRQGAPRPRGEHEGPDGTRLARLGRLPTGEMGVRVYNLDTGKAAVTLAPGPLPRAAGWRARFTPDGARVAHAGYGAVRVFDLKTGRVRQTWPAGDRYRHVVTFLPDGRLVGGGDAALVWPAAK